jgi:hypothetical protein
VSSSLEFSYPATPAGPSRTLDAAAIIGSTSRILADSPGLLFQATLEATARAGVPSVDSPKGASTLFLELREAETSLLPTSSLALRGGLLLRNFGIGSAGSPANPFARGTDQGGFWGFDAEWTGSASLSAIAILSIDRMARSRSISGIADFDSGLLLRFSPGAVDAAAGLYTAGAGGGELRPITYISLPVLGCLASLEAAVSLPLGPIDPAQGGGTQESLRFELRRSVDIGGLGLELGAAYRGIYPGRSEAEMGDLVAAAPAAGLPPNPFAPFYGRHYAELSLQTEGSDGFSIAANVALALPWSSSSYGAQIGLPLGSAELLFALSGVAGGRGAEFSGLAPYELVPALDFKVGVDFSY